MPKNKKHKEGAKKAHADHLMNQKLAADKENQIDKVRADNRKKFMKGEIITDPYLDTHYLPKVKNR